jgi:HSP20 family protein
MAFFDWTYNPLGEIERMRREMDDLFGRIGYTPSFTSAFPPVNLYDQGDEILVAAEVPGVPKEKLTVDLRENVLTLSGTRERASYPNASPLREETPSGEFSKSIRLPVRVAPDKVEATCKNGILHIRLAKSEESKPKQIAIQA